MSHRSQLAQVVGEFLAKRCSPYVMDPAGQAGADGELWDAVEELGWTLPTLPEDEGGSAASFADACTIVREAARHAAPLPIAETGLLAGWMLSAAGLPVPGGQMTIAPVRREERITAALRGDRYIFAGRAGAVPWASTASTIVVSASGEGGKSLTARVPAELTDRVDGENIAGEPRSEVDFAGVQLPSSDVAVAPSHTGFDEVMARGALVRAVAMLGALERVLDLTVGYAKERHQFGRAIGSFQAIAHHIARIAREVALARAAVESATEATVDRSAPPALEVAVAKVVCGCAAGPVARLAHQVHGAIGVTREYPLQLFTRRLWAWREEFGSERDWAAVLGSAAVEAEGGLWELVSSIDETNGV